jgi:hypothetical protein
MVRTLITLDEEDKRWLEERSAAEGVPMAQLIRRAVKQMREQEDMTRRREALLGATRGLGSGEDGLRQQRKLRSEWNERAR